MNNFVIAAFKFGIFSNIENSKPQSFFMKKTLLTFSLLFAVGLIYAQCGNGCNDRSYHNNTVYSTTTVQKPKLEYKVFPNPTMNSIQIDDQTAESVDVQSFRIFNMLGQEMKAFNVVKGQTYSVADLRPGTYLIQFRNARDKVVTTKKLVKTDGEQFN